MNEVGWRFSTSPIRLDGLLVCPTSPTSRVRTNDAVCLAWVGLVREPGTCASTRRYTYLQYYFPMNGDYSAYGETARLCKLFLVVAIFSAIHTAVLIAWFGWTLWLTTKVARTMGDPWTRDKVLKRISMGKISKLHQWREGDGEQLGMGKVHTTSRDEYGV
jgi:hypothetical protein